MARWVFPCKNCFKVVPHAEIGGTLMDYFFPKKPEVPVEGQELVRIPMKLISVPG
jgi:hypothetical protein